MDFVQIAVKEKRGGGLEAYPDFIVGRSEDLMVRAKGFYAVHNAETGMWSQDEYDVQRFVDDKLHSYQKENPDVTSIKTMRSFGSNGQSTFRKYLASIGDNAHQLDEKLTFLSTKVSKKDYVSKRLPYDLAPGDISAWDRIVGTLYKPAEREKIEWFLGAIVAGKAKNIQKFMVLFGPPGAGKGTIINIALKMFPGYVTTFDSKALGSSNNQFASAAFENNPLLGIEHDGDLSRIDDNTKLNMIVSHEIMKINQKNKPAFDAKINTALLMGTNKAVKITDAQSGLIRRLIDVSPSNVKLASDEYDFLMSRIDFELGAIAYHCKEVFDSLGKDHYKNYIPMEMMYKTNAFFNFIEYHHDLFTQQNGCSAKMGWELYKKYKDEAELEKGLSNYQFKAEFGNYFEEFLDRHTMPDGTQVRSWYHGFKAVLYKTPTSEPKAEHKFTLTLTETTSLLDVELEDYPAQYAKSDGNPSKYWDDGERLINKKMQKPRPSQVVDTRLRDLDTHQVHYTKIPENMIVIDLDLEDENGEKSLERNLAAAALWKPTYAELSRSGKAVHLHYYYDGDVTQLDPDYSAGIEVKVYAGNQALRRRLSLCNNVPISVISSGLPIKERKRVLNEGQFASQQGLVNFIENNLDKKYHISTKSSIDFIKKGLDDAYEDGLIFDVAYLRPRIIVFATNSSHQADVCLQTVAQMRWTSNPDVEPDAPAPPRDEREVFYDIECYPNLFLICWMFKPAPGEEPRAEDVTPMLNPTAQAVESLMNLKLIAYNARGYDNHMLHAAAMGCNNEQLYALSQRLISNQSGAENVSAYNVSYTDPLDFASKKQSLKRWQLDLELPHHEMDLPWDQPVPEERVRDVIEYCISDVLTLVKVFEHLEPDWKARQFLTALSGLTENDKTAKHVAAYVFGKDKNPKREFVYTDLSKEFPGYVYEMGKSYYRDELVSEGGFVRGTPGLYRNVVLLDVASMHPTSIGMLNLFGPNYTPRYMAIVEAQLALKHNNLDHARTLLDGKLVPFIEEIEKLAETDPVAAKKGRLELRYALKIAMNIVYGMTSASFENIWRDKRNVDNIVAKRGALFMLDLKNYIETEGGVHLHFKTDSVKLLDPSDELIEKVQNFATKYGYTMEVEARYEKFGLVDKAQYVALHPEKGWLATGKQFSPEYSPYVYKRLFGGDINFFDMREIRSVREGHMYLDFGDELTEDGTARRVGYVDAAVRQLKNAEKMVKLAEKPTASREDKELAAKQLATANESYAHALAQLVFVGKIGRFTPVIEGYGGGQLYRVKDGKHYAVSDTKGYLWIDSELAADLPDEAIDVTYFDEKTNDAYENLAKWVDDSEFDSMDEFLGVEKAPSTAEPEQQEVLNELEGVVLV